MHIYKECDEFDWCAIQIYILSSFPTSPNYRNERIVRGRIFLLCSAVSFRRPIFLGNQCTCDLGMTAVNGNSPWYCGIGGSGHVSTPSCVGIACRLAALAIAVSLRRARRSFSCIDHHLRDASSSGDLRSARGYLVYARVPTCTRAWTDARVHLVSGVSSWSPVESRIVRDRYPRHILVAQSLFQT